ncbi:tape measure protein [Diaphorobacter sp. HDW4A]|uniref:tape measure protein n=1 Tax=Diaphorobacter sp. HDW4A TaxID=2714924 RepID=UPI00140D8F2B|nr:tape measure protein [Diaphorobacter sp. HDW4A]QIL81813.1 tape measure protein [Diaphorobacter sp. HDW4A]
MADKQVSYRINAEATGQESVARMADELDELAKILDKELAQKAQSTAARLRELGEQDAAITNFIQLKSQSDAAATALSRAETEASGFAKQIAASGPPTAQEAANLQRLQATVDSTRAAFGQQLEAVNRAQGELQRYGVAGQTARGVQERLRAEIVQVAQSVQELSPAYQRAANGAATAGASMTRTHRAIGEGVESISAQLARLQQFYVGLQSVRGLTNMGLEFAQTADQVTNLQSRMKLVTGEAENFKQGWEGVVDVALRTHSALEGTGTLFTRIAQTGKDAGLSSQNAAAQALALTETINQTIQISGASAEASSAAITQLVQGLQSGVLRGDEFNSVMEQAPRLARALADGLGVTTGELRKMAEAGALSADTVIRALRGQSDTIATEFQKLPPTVGRALQDLSTQWSLYVSEVDQANGVSAKAASMIDMLSGNLRTVAGLLIDVGQAAAGFAALRLAQYFLGISTATAAATTATTAHTAATVANTAATTANAAAKTANTAATSANAAANVAAAVTTGRAAAGVGAQVAAASGAITTAAASAGRLFAALKFLRSFTLVGLIVNLKDIGTWMGETAAKLAGYKDRTKELAEAEKAAVEVTKEVAASRARMADATQAAIDKQFDLSKAARTAVDAFTQLTKNGELSASAVKKVTENFDLTKVQGIKDFTATLDKLVADGKLGAGEFQAEWAKALEGKDLAQFEVMARQAFGQAVAVANAAAADVKNAIAAGVSGEELDELEVKARVALGAVGRDGERLGSILDASLREAVKRSGLEFTQLQGNIGTAARSAINDVEAIVTGMASLKDQGVDVSRVLSASLSKAINTADGQAAIDSLKQRIESLRGQLGDKITDGLLEQAKVKADELKDAVNNALPGIQGVREAMKQLGITSDASLKDTAKSAKDAYDVMRSSGQASARELSEGFKRAAEAAIEANKGIAPSWVTAEAGVRGYDLAVDQAGKTTLKVRQVTGNAAGGMAGDWKGVQSSVEGASRALQEYQQLVKQKYGKPGEGDKPEQLGEGVEKIGSGYRNKDGMTSDAKGQAQQQFVWTQATIIDYLKQSGIEAKVAEELSKQFLNSNGDVNYDASIAQQRWGGKYSTLSQALGKMSEYYQFGDGKHEYADMQADGAKKPDAPSPSPSPSPSPAPSPSPGGGSGGNTYINNITIYGVGQWGSVKGTTTHTTAQSASTEERLLRELAESKGVAQ